MNRTTIECDRLAAFLSPGPRMAPERDSSESGTLEFTGTRSYGEAVRIMRDGWPAGAEQARALSAQLAAETADSLTTERPTPVWDVAGDDADVSRYLAGEPENMVAWMPEAVPAAGRVVRLLLAGRVAWMAEAVPAAGRVVRVVLDAGVNCTVKEEHLQAAGVMTAAAADVLEARIPLMAATTGFRIRWISTMER